MKLNQLTFTRFVAAILVVGYHTGTAHLGPDSVIGRLLGVSNGAVSYFFALSGFILVVSSVRDNQLAASIPKGIFWLNRVARIYPLYLVALLLTLLLAVVTNNDVRVTISFESVSAGMLLLQSWFPPLTMQLNYPAWSLSAELFFYLLFPFFYAGGVRQRTSTLLLMATLIWGVSLAVCVTLIDRATTASVILEPALYNLALYLPLLHLNTFIAGVVTGIVFVRHYEYLTRHRHWVAGALLASLAIGLWIIEGRLPALKYYHNGLFAPLFCLFILWLSGQRNRLTRWLNRPFPVWLGEISYGIYLLQVPVGMITFYLNYNWLHWPVWLYVSLYLVVLIGLSAVCYRHIEQPARRFIRQWTTSGFTPRPDEPVPGLV